MTDALRVIAVKDPKPPTSGDDVDDLLRWYSGLDVWKSVFFPSPALPK